MALSGSSAARADVYSRITSEIIQAIEHGPGEWRAPWHHNGTSIARPTNLGSGKRYRGINTVALWVAAMNGSYIEGLWGTYRQWGAAGAQVRKGERATTVVFWKQIEAGDEDMPDEEEGGRVKMFARAFSVFNLARGRSPCPCRSVHFQTRRRNHRWGIGGILSPLHRCGAHAPLRLFPGSGVFLWCVAARERPCIGREASPGSRSFRSVRVGLLCRRGMLCRDSERANPRGSWPRPSSAA